MGNLEVQPSPRPTGTLKSYICSVLAGQARGLVALLFLCLRLVLSFGLGLLAFRLRLGLIFGLRLLGRLCLNGGCCSLLRGAARLPLLGHESSSARLRS